MAVIAAAPVASAQQPNPPPNPTDEQLQASRSAVVQRAAEIGRLSGRLAELDRQAATLAGEVAEYREQAFQRLLELQDARAAADEAAREAERARQMLDAAGKSIEYQRARVDKFVAAEYEQSLDLGPLRLLSGATSPEDLIARAELRDLVASDQQQALNGLERARVEQANADSAARAAREQAQARQGVAEKAKTTADAAVGTAESALAAQQAKLKALDEQRAEVERQLDKARTADGVLRQQRERFVDYQRRVAEEEAARRRAAGDAAAADPDLPARSGSPTDVDASAGRLGAEYDCRSKTPRWGPIKGWVAEAGNLLRCRFGVRAVGGVGSRPNPSDHPAGLALDFMVGMGASGTTKGDTLADCALRNKDRLSVKYVIFRQRINTGTGWRPMADRGSPVANHMEHVHISFRGAPPGSVSAMRC